MRVVIMGMSRISEILIRILEKEGHHIIAIDIDENRFNKLPEDFKGEKIVGSGTDLDIYKKINFNDSDAFLAATNSDNINIEAAKLIKENFKSERIGKVIRDPLRAKAFTEVEQGVICPILDAALYFRDKMLG